MFLSCVTRFSYWKLICQTHPTPIPRWLIKIRKTIFFWNTFQLNLKWKRYINFGNEFEFLITHESTFWFFFKSGRGSTRPPPPPYTSTCTPLSLHYSDLPHLARCWMLTRACVLVLNRGGTYWNPAGRIQRSTDTEARARSRIPSLVSIKGG